MLRRLEELCNLNGVSGDEGRVRRYIKNIANDYADDVWVDTMGNLYAHKKGEGKKVVVTAHMDEVGMIIWGAMENGLLIYQTQGIDPRVVVSKRVVIGEKEIPGVIGAKAIHLQSMADREKVLPHSELFIDIGAKDKADALKTVERGDYAAFATKWERLGNDKMKAKALDDRMGCAIALELLKNTYDCDFTAVFTVQEELGLRGAQAAVYNVKPDVALVLEGTTANDMPKAEGHQHVTKVGGGPAISFMDGATIVPRKMFEALKKTAEEEGIPYQLKQAVAGGNDAGAIHKALSGCVTGVISVATRYIHSPCSVASITDFENTYKLADAFLRTGKFNEV